MPVNVRDFGAIGDGVSLDTEAIQAAIKQAAGASGGTVIVPPGTFRIGTLKLLSGVRLRLEEGATLLGSDDPAYYLNDPTAFTDAVGQRRGRCLILAHSVERIAIEGRGTIDGNGIAFADPPKFDDRPFLIRLVGCREVMLSGVMLKNSAAWVCHMLDCEQVRVTDVTIQSRVNDNNDGIDIDSCRDVVVSDCNIDTGDDSICLKSTLDRPCEDIVVRWCRLRSECGTIKIGTESYGDIRRVDIHDCHVKYAGLSAIKVISMDGAVVEDIDIRDVTIDQATGPIFVRLGERSRTYHSGQEPKPAGAIRRVRIDRVQATVITPDEGGVDYFTQRRVPPTAFSGILVTGIPGHCVEDLTLSNMVIQFVGGGDAQDALASPEEQVSAYPEQFHFGVLPASMMLARHVRGLTLDRVDFQARRADARPAIILQDVEGAAIPEQSSKAALVR